jgi:hypothetical protein
MKIKKLSVVNEKLFKNFVKNWDVKFVGTSNFRKLFFLHFIFLLSLNSCNSESKNKSVQKEKQTKNIEIKFEIAKQDLSSKRITWYNANELAYDKGEGWRLPTIDELKLMYGMKDDFGDMQENIYWSTSLKSDNEYDNAEVLCLNFEKGPENPYPMPYDKEGKAFVRLVRSKVPITETEKRIKNGSLIIAKKDFPELLTLHEAIKACENLGKGWRLPTKRELFHLYIAQDRIFSSSDIEKFENVRFSKYDDLDRTDEENSYFNYMYREKLATYITSDSVLPTYSGYYEYFSFLFRTGEWKNESYRTKYKVRAVWSSPEKTQTKNVRIGNLEVAANDFDEKMSYYEAKKQCKLLGEGWRLPTIEELKIISQNSQKFRNFFIELPEDVYWSNDDVSENVQYFYRRNKKMIYGERSNNKPYTWGHLVYSSNTANKFKVRPVRTII